MAVLPLTDIRRESVIYAVSTPNPLRRRLFDLGFVPGAYVTPLASNRSLAVYGIGCSLIALRRSTAAQIFCTLLPDSKEEAYT